MYIVSNKSTFLVEKQKNKRVCQNADTLFFLSIFYAFFYVSFTSPAIVTVTTPLPPRYYRVVSRQTDHYFTLI